MSDVDANQPTTRRRASVREAAEFLGISVDAVRGRIKRGSLGHGKAEDGSVYVWLETDVQGDRSQADDDQGGDQPQLDNDHTPDQSALIEALQDEVAHLRAQARVRDEEIRRRDHLLAAALERIPPALESASDGPGYAEPGRTPPSNPESAAEEAEAPTPRPATSAPQEAPQRPGRAPSWWRRLLG